MDLDEKELEATKSKGKTRKIIEIYVTENKEENSISFDFEKIEDTEIANYTIKMLLMMFNTYKRDEDDLEVEYESE